jgi:tryptophanyl-tRNA synthetase
MGIATDSTAVADPKPTENSTLLALHRLVASEADHQQMIADFQRGGVGYGEFKKRLLEAMLAHFAPMRERRAEILAKPEQVEEILADGAQKARCIARATLQRVRDAVGLGLPKT